MFTVALVGPDGAGKSTIGRKLQQISPLPMRYVYMGVNLESSNLVLPTTRLILEIKRARGGRPDMAGYGPSTRHLNTRPEKLLKRLAEGSKEAMRMLNLTAEEWFRQMVVWYYKAKGYLVLFDRHFYFDYYSHDVVNTDPQLSLTRRLHGWMLQKLYPKPDFVIFLDAPAEVLFARKPEGTLEGLEARRQEYVRMRDAVKEYAVVDVTRPVDEVAQEISELIVKFCQNKNGVNARTRGENA
jgi:thymidylate kinase